VGSRVDVGTGPEVGVQVHVGEGVSVEAGAEMVAPATSAVAGRGAGVTTEVVTSDAGGASGILATTQRPATITSARTMSMIEPSAT
jgi:hypothetical protein